MARKRVHICSQLVVVLIETPLFTLTTDKIFIQIDRYCCLRNVARLLLGGGEEDRASRTLDRDVS